MKLSKKAIIVSLIATVILVILIVIAAVIKNDVSKPKNLLKALQEGVDLKFKGFNFTEVNEANAKWEVKAETATYSKKQDIAVLEKIQYKVNNVRW